MARIPAKIGTALVATSLSLSCAATRPLHLVKLHIDVSDRCSESKKTLATKDILLDGPNSENQVKPQSVEIVHVSIYLPDQYCEKKTASWNADPGFEKEYTYDWHSDPGLADPGLLFDAKTKNSGAPSPIPSHYLDPGFDSFHGNDPWTTDTGF